MRLPSILLCLAAALPVVTAVANSSVAFAGLATLSKCGSQCVLSKIPVVGCSLTDFNCQCASPQLPAITAECLYENCTLSETLAVSKFSAAVCEKPSESKNEMLKIMTYVCATITNGAVLLRVLIKLWLQMTFSMDDLFIGLAIVSAAVFTYYGVLFENNGFGTHIWDVDPVVVPDLLYWFYICEALYILTIALVKLSIVSFYLKVFVNKPFRLACWATIAFIVVIAIAFILAGVFQCTPIYRAWQLGSEGTCINYNAVAWVNAGINIFQDILIVLLPVKELWSLQMSTRKKAGLYAMFAVGGFTCVTGIIRLYTLKNFGLTADPTWDNVPTIFWSTLETTAAVFCACMPTMRAGLKRVSPRIWGETGFFRTTKNSSTSTGGSSSNWGSRISKKAGHMRWMSSDAQTSRKGANVELGIKSGDMFVRLEDGIAPLTNRRELQSNGKLLSQVREKEKSEPIILYSSEMRIATSPEVGNDKPLPAVPVSRFNTTRSVRSFRP